MTPLVIVVSVKREIKFLHTVWPIVKPILNRGGLGENALLLLKGTMLKCTKTRFNCIEAKFEANLLRSI